MVWFHSVPAYGGSVLSDSILLAQNDFEKEFTDWLSAVQRLAIRSYQYSS